MTKKFKELQTVPDFPAMERDIIKYWESLDIVQLLKKARAGSEEKVYYDGPITANNMPHYGHTVQWTIKDLVPRYWSMKNYFVSRNMGWDCQGIPVEYEVEKELKFEKKEDIEAFGIAKFNELCRKSVEKYKDSIFHYETRLGRWFDVTDMYSTMDKDYIESMWWSLKELYKKDLLYEGHKVVAYSTRAGTTLSTHEVNAGGYADIEDPYVTVKFKILAPDFAGTFFLAWTTTPWTMPGNLLLAVGKDITYALVEANSEKYILAKEVVDTVFKEQKYKILKEYSAEELVGLDYSPPFTYFADKKNEGCFKVVAGEHVTTEEGTGIVHLAPYGAEDFEIFMNLGISLFDYLDDTAHFTELVPEYEGEFYLTANEKIISVLAEKEVLFNTGKIVHRMPMCWRTDTPLIYKPIKSWYVAVTKIKAKMVAENARIKWMPEHVGKGRAGEWIANAKDWALSRSRYWGTPLPVWVNDKTNEKVFIGSFQELKELAGVELEDPHRPFVDEITWEDKKNGGTFKRVKDVIDVWYDSGSMPFAQLHYPFEGQELFDQKVPADFVCEMHEQARLWFYTMLVINVALFDKVPYENVVAHGVMLDKDGKKLSKSKRNFPPMDDVLDQFGGDILRYFILNSPIVQAEGARFHNEVLDEARKEFFIPLWNCVKYFSTFANLHNFVPTGKKPAVENVLDKWILARLQQTVNVMTENLDVYNILPATREVRPFIDDLSAWYIRRSRDRISSGEPEALQTLHYVLADFTRLLAPLLPFVSETLYENLGLRELTGLVSVHLDFYPEPNELTPEQVEILANMAQDRETISLALSIRVSTGIGVRQPLDVCATANKVYSKRLIMDEVNVKSVVAEISLSDFIKENAAQKPITDASQTVALTTELSEDLLVEGAARNLIRKIQGLRKKQGLNVEDSIEVVYVSDDLTEKAIKLFETDIKTTTNATNLTAGTEFKIEPK